DDCRVSRRVRPAQAKGVQWAAGPMRILVMRHNGPLEYATPDVPRGRRLVPISVAVFSLPLLATTASFMALWTENHPGRVDDALMCVILGVLPAILLSALQYVAVFRRARAVADVVMVLSMLGGVCWLSLLCWRFSLQLAD